MMTQAIRGGQARIPLRTRLPSRSHCGVRTGRSRPCCCALSLRARLKLDGLCRHARLDHDPCGLF